LPPNSVTIGPRIAAAEGKDDIPRPAMLTSRGVQVLSRIERLFDEAARVPAPAAARAQGQQTELETVGPRGIVAADQGREAKVGN
jgi:hypothetical protein